MHRERACTCICMSAADYDHNSASARDLEVNVASAVHELELARPLQLLLNDFYNKSVRLALQTRIDEQANAVFVGQII